MIEMLQAYLEAQSDNSFFSGGLALGIVGVVGGIAARIAWALAGLGRGLISSEPDAY